MKLLTEKEMVVPGLRLLVTTLLRVTRAVPEFPLHWTAELTFYIIRRLRLNYSSMPL